MSKWQEANFGRIPRDWDLKKISDIKDNNKRAIAMGPFGSNIKAENFVKHGIPVIRGTNFNFAKYVGGDFVYLTEEKANELIGSNCKAGDLVFTHRGTIGQVGLIPSGKFPRYVISQSGMKLSVDPNLMDSNFLFYFFKSEFGQYQILKYESQVGVPSISNPLTSLKEIEVPVPCLPEQKAIASVLSSLDDKIDLLHRLNKTLEAMAETLFRQWFVEEVEDDWGEVTIGDYVELNRASIDKNYPYQVIEYLDTGSLTEGKIESFQSFALNDAPSRARRLIQHNDVLISTVRPDQKHYGIIKNPIENLVVSTGFCVLTCTKIDPHFIYLLLTNDEMTDYLHTIAEGSTSTYPSLKPSDIGSIAFQLPPRGKLEEFSVIAQNSWEKIEKNHIQIRTLEILRDTLLPKLMSGEVRVTV